VQGYFDECEIQLNELLKNYLNNVLGYNVNVVRNAHFFKAEIERKKLNIKSAKENYLKSIEYSIQMNNQRLGYTLYSYYYLGKIEYDNRNFKTSKQYFKRVIRLSKRKEKINIDSRNYLRKIK
jgi:tetratricopeptide (TPR) repeat protein